jgi:iron complex outermembrane receptor protein
MLLASTVFASALLGAQSPETHDFIEVTATRMPDDVRVVPASITIVTAGEMEARGVRDLAGALELVAGISIAPGGDGGPASSVPELWGLREFDAFLLVVDDVPWGGAFNPALASLDMTGVERVEVIRGAAPVMYGATSFVGVIHVIHAAAGSAGTTASVGGGSYESFDAHVVTQLPSSASYRQSIVASGESRGFADDRTSFDRLHALYRASADSGIGTIRLDADVSLLRQDPASPHPRQGRTLSPLVPLDANHNPSDAKLDEERIHLVAGHETTAGPGSWKTLLAYTHTSGDVVRGFLSDVSEDAPNANGYAQDRSVDDLYFDTHGEFRLNGETTLVAGVDYLYGRAELESNLFAYGVGLDGSGAPSSSSLPLIEDTGVEDVRNFSGTYVQGAWTPDDRWRVDAGLRLNHTVEEHDGEEGDRDSRSVTRGSGTIGASWLAVRGATSTLRLFTDYRNTYKPAAFDFGPDDEGGILDPETGESVELGAKYAGISGRLEIAATLFRTDLENIVVSQAVNGLPSLVNGGSERLEGIELEGSWRFSDALRAQLAYANHLARFVDYQQEFDGVNTRLDGNRIEMSPRNLGALGLVYAPASGLGGNVVVNYVGERYLNKRNTALAEDFTTWSAGLSYRHGKWDVRLDGVNLGDRRDPVADSELGDAQYYRLPARSVRAGVAIHLN